MLGNKCDQEKQREVSRDEGLSLASNLAAGFFEVSAFTGENIEEVVHRCKHKIPQSDTVTCVSFCSLFQHYVSFSFGSTRRPVLDSQMNLSQGR